MVGGILAAVVMCGAWGLLQHHLAQDGEWLKGGLVGGALVGATGATIGYFTSDRRRWTGIIPGLVAACIAAVAMYTSIKLAMRGTTLRMSDLDPPLEYFVPIAAFASTLGSSRGASVRRERSRLATAVMVAIILVGATVFAVMVFAIEDTPSSASGTAALQGQWVNVTSPGDWYTLDFPAGAKPSIELVDLPDGGSSEAHSLRLLTDGDGDFGASVAEYDFSSRPESIDLLGGTTALFDEYGGALDDFSPELTAEGNTASFTGHIDNPRSAIRGYAIEVDKHLLVIFISVPADDAHVADEVLYRAVASLHRR